MFLINIVTAFLSFIIFSNEINQDSNDSTTAKNLKEALIIKDEQQNKIDSLIKYQLKEELKKATGNRSRTDELELKLRQISRNDSLRRIQQLAKIKELKKNTIGYPVTLNSDTLFFLYTRTGSFNAKDRAHSISNKINRLFQDPFYRSDSLVINKNEDSYDLIYNKSEIILTVANLDGLWFGKSNEELAKEYLSLIKRTIAKEREANSLLNLLKRFGLVVLIIIVLGLMVVLINRVFKTIATCISDRKEQYVSTLRLKNVRIITPEHLENALLKILTVIKIAVKVLVVYLSLPLLFSLFPETEEWTGTLLSWILAPLRSAVRSFVDYLPDFFKVVVIYFIFKYLIKAIKYFFYEIKFGNIQLKGFHADWALPTFNILRFILYCFMLVLVFPFLPGSDSPAFQGVSVFLGILISLGSSSAITNIVAGLVITYMRPFRVGDRVKIGEVTGDVLEKTMLVTRIKTIKNEDITVPNSSVLSSSTINYSSHTKNEKQGLIVHYTVTVGYDVAWTTVYDLLIQAAQKTIYIEDSPKPFVLQISLDDFYISYQINAYTKEANKQAIIYSNLLENIQDVFKSAGIDFVSPSYHVIKDGGRE